MNLPVLLMVDDPVAELLHTVPKPGAMTPKEILTISAALTAAAIAAFLIVLYFYRRTKTGRRRRRHHHSSEAVSESGQGSGQGSGRRRRRKRPMNTTLAEAGGLPPKRAPGVPPQGT